MNILTIILVIYFIGCVISYLICKKSRTSEENDWEHVIISFGYASFSWIFVIIFLIWYIWGVDVFENNEPPKWL